MALITPSASDAESRQLMVPPPSTAVVADEDAFRRHRQRIEAELEMIGVPRYVRATRAVRHLPYIIHPDEHLEAVVSGRETAVGGAILVSTDRRIVFVVKKLFFLRDDEIGFRSVRGVSYMHSVLSSHVVLHTQMGDYSVRTFNRQCADAFMKSIERHGLEGAGI